MILNILAFAFVFGTFVFTHEFGHFAVAKGIGIRVYEFALGFGPRIAKVRRGETVYSLRLFPLGGFVKLAGMDRTEEGWGELGEDDKGSFKNKSLPGRMATIGAGPAMNFLAAFLLFFAVFFAKGVPVTVIERVFPGSPAQAAGILPKDKVIAINDSKVETSAEVVHTINTHPNQTLKIQVMRNGEKRVIRATPRLDPEKGVGMLGIAIFERLEKVGFLESVRTGIRYTFGVGKSLVVGVIRMISGRVAPEVSGPIGIARVAGETARLGLIYLLFLAAVLNVNLGLLNLLPIPVLDGGWLFLLGVEAFRRKPLDPEQEAFARFVGMAFLVLLMLFATLSDIARLGA